MFTEISLWHFMLMVQFTLVILTINLSTMSANSHKSISRCRSRPL